jgi:hypothetical protein
MKFLPVAFSSEVDPGSREENASNNKERRFGQAAAIRRTADSVSPRTPPKRPQVLEKLHGTPGNTNGAELTGPAAYSPAGTGRESAAGREPQATVPSIEIGWWRSAWNVKVLKLLINIAVFLLSG